MDNPPSELKCCGKPGLVSKQKSIIIRGVIFEWDQDKADANLKKHRVRFEEAESVFYDSLSMTIPDPDHSIDEHRFIDIGTSENNRLLVVVYTERKDRIRIISARRATKSERKKYEKEK